MNNIKILIFKCDITLHSIIKKCLNIESRKILLFHDLKIARALNALNVFNLSPIKECDKTKILLNCILNYMCIMLKYCPIFVDPSVFNIPNTKAFIKYILVQLNQLNFG